MDLLGSQWDSIKEYIRTEYNIKNIAYNIWLAPLLYEGCEGNVVSVMIPNSCPELCSYIEDHYKELLEETLLKLMQKEYKVRFVSRNQEEADMSTSCNRSDLLVSNQLTEEEKRINFLRDLVKSHDYEMPDEVFDYIIKYYDMLNLRCAYTNLRIANVKDLETAQKVLKETILSGRRNLITPEMVLQAISEYYHLDPEKIKTSRRNVEYIRPKQIFMYLCREMTDLTLKDIAFILNIEKSVNPFGFLGNICNEIDKTQDLKEQIDAIRKRIMLLYSKGMV